MLNRANLEDPERNPGRPCFEFAKVRLFLYIDEIRCTRLSDLKISSWATLIDRNSFLIEILIPHLRGHNNVIVMLDSIEQSSLQLTPKNIASLPSLSI